MLALATGCLTPLPGVFEFETFSDRSAGSAVPVAPPPPSLRGRMEIQARELGTTNAPALAAGPHGANGLDPWRTDGVLGVVINDWFAFRALGGLAYGAPSIVGTPSVPISSRPAMTGGFGTIFGWWGERDWSVSLELDYMLSLLAGTDQYQVLNGHCSMGIAIFGGSPLSCSGAPTGEVRNYQGYFAAPNLGATLDGAGWVAPWLRLGASASLQGIVTRDQNNAVSWQPVGIVRAFAELHYEDVWLGIEAQEGFSDVMLYGPMIAGTFGIAYGDAHRPTHPAPAR